MGQFIAAAASAVAPVLSSVLGFIGDNPQTIATMKKMADSFTSEANAEQNAMLALAGLPVSRTPIVIDFATELDTPEDAKSAASAALDAATSSVTKYYQTQFSKVAAQPADAGFAAKFDVNGDISTAITQMNDYFSRNNIPTTNNPAAKMAQTIKAQMKARQGITGKSAGKTYLNNNQAVCWAVMYGDVADPSGENALLYGFIAGFDSGFGS
ncbi:hypothetical protein [uncultured Gimesia sp.]|uniref:hypothetical protein n=1 Tax=uncultured Gimesia sp. TaxID=1678688 RepID=UPI0030D96DA7|tara:strand:- start:27661 stop:28296 length:636 start_codon:yes stop_codon:yes gene_type:complete